MVREVSIDFSVVRAYQHAAGARNKGARVALDLDRAACWEFVIARIASHSALQ